MRDAGEDALLVQRAQQGDRQAFDALVRKHEGRAYQFAYRLTQSPEEAADVVAEAFVRVYNALPNFRGNSVFTTWLYRILTNCYLDLRKRERIRRHESLDATVATEEGEVTRQFVDPSPTPGTEVETSERNEALVRAIGKLPEYQQAMIVMFHVEMLSYEDIAEALDLPLGTVKSRLNRARLSLRQLLQDQLELFR